jgi:hypothetical protein
VTDETLERREDLIRQITDRAGEVVFGSLSEAYRTCGNPGCRCHSKGPKHGPHLQIAWPGDHGKTTGCYVPIAAQEQIRKGADAWQAIQVALRELGTLNRDDIISQARAAKAADRGKSPGTASRPRARAPQCVKNGS